MAEITKLNEQTFNDAISESDVPVLVDFWAPWCGPCKAIAPILEELAGELEGKVQISKVNVDENGTVAAKYNIRAIPTLLLFKGGELVDQFVGMVRQDDLKTKLQAPAGFHPALTGLDFQRPSTIGGRLFLQHSPLERRG